MDEKEARSAVMGAISMALKDPTLQQGFEIICKENAELKKSCGKTQELLDKQIEATYKLVEENAELKKENESLTNVKNIYVGDLLKAKEIIKKFLDAKSIEETCVAESEAEQFLSEVEK